MDSARVSGLVRAAGCSPAEFLSEHEQGGGYSWNEARKLYPGVWDEE
jgi:hypothetical protein